MHPTVLSYDQAFTAGPSAVGGKGWNLARLHRYGFPVPPGGVLVADVYRRLVGRDDLAGHCRSLAGVRAEDVTQDGVTARLADLRRAVEQADLPPGVMEGIDDFLRREGLAGRPVAVRSSALAEDGTSASFAGIHASSLNVTGTEEVVRAVKGCYASLWTPQALAYRRRLGVADEAVACAVVVCAMVQARCAGVAFSCDPRTGRRDLVVINAAPGLGEALVQGSVNPEQVTVQLRGGRLHLVARAGQVRTDLTESDFLALARLTLRVHWALGEGQDPQDVEWAHDGRQFWLLQARPVTRLPRWTFPPVAEQPLHWSSANIKDALPGVLSWLGWSAAVVAVGEMLYAVQQAVGYPVPPGMEVVRRFNGRAFFDLTGMEWAFYDCLGVTPGQLAHQLGGHQPEIAVPPGSPFRGRAGLRRLWARVKLLRRLGRLERELPPIMRDIRARSLAARGTDRSGWTLGQLREDMYRWGDLGAWFNPLFQLANGNSGGWTLLAGLLDRLTGGRGTPLVTRLLAGTGEVTSAEHGYRLVELAAVARTDPPAARLLREDPAGWQSLPADSPFRRALERYLADFGHRAIGEVDVANPRWVEDPSYLLEQVRFHLEAGTDESRRAGARATRESAEEELRRVSWLFRPLVSWLLRRARRAMGLREAGKSALVAILEPCRQVVLEVGRRFCAAGHLDAPRDAFDLTVFDLDAFLCGEWTGAGARTLAADRKARRAEWLTRPAPDVLTVEPEHRPGAGAWKVPAAATAGVDGRWSGVGVAAGRAEGPARVVRHPSEGHRLLKGEVLVAPSTDPGWTPLFLRAGAVVMETGGYLSHGAIVAREYGLPAVVNIPGLLEAVRDGDRLVVDGDNGTVTRRAGAP